MILGYIRFGWWVDWEWVNDFSLLSSVLRVYTSGEDADADWTSLLPSSSWSFRVQCMSIPVFLQSRLIPLFSSIHVVVSLLVPPVSVVSPLPFPPPLLLLIIMSQTQIFMCASLSFPFVFSFILREREESLIPHSTRWSSIKQLSSPVCVLRHPPLFFGESFGLRHRLNFW